MAESEAKQSDPRKEAAGARARSAVEDILGLVAAGADFLIWYGGSVNEKAQSIHRKLDLADSLGWSIAAHELSDYAVSLNNPRSLPRKGNYFASTKPPGLERAVENLVESSWWSKHLAKTMARKM